MQHPVENYLGDASLFLDKVFDSLGRDGIDASEYELDHLCYRVETEERYQELKEVLSQFGELLAEEQINGTPISTFKFQEPLEYKERKISCIEIPSPGEKNTYPEGYEHVEFVIREDLLEVFMAKYPEISFDIKALSKEINPDIRRVYDGHSVKFHQHTLEHVIKYLQ